LALSKLKKFTAPFIAASSLFSTISAPALADTFDLTITGIDPSGMAPAGSSAGSSASGTIEIDTGNVTNNGASGVIPSFITGLTLNLDGNTYNLDHLRGVIFHFTGTIDFSQEVIAQMQDFNVFRTSGTTGTGPEGQSPFVFEDKASSTDYRFTAMNLAGVSSSNVQPYAAMQNVGMNALKNQRNIVLDNAGECVEKGWQIDDSKYCFYGAYLNTTSDIYGDSNVYGAYATADSNSSYGLEYTIDDQWTVGGAYGSGVSNLHDYSFSGTTASINSKNNFYSIYSTKKSTTKDLKYSAIISLADIQYNSTRTVSSNTATGKYDADGYSAELNAVWNKTAASKILSPEETRYFIKPLVGVAFGNHNQNSFTETGDGSLMTISNSKSASLLFKTGVTVATKIPTNNDKWLFVPSVGVNYEVDVMADRDGSRGIEAKIASSSSAATRVLAKTAGEQLATFNLGADLYLDQNFMLNANAGMSYSSEGEQSSIGGGFRWLF